MRGPFRFDVVLIDCVFLQSIILLRENRRRHLRSSHGGFPDFTKEKGPIINVSQFLKNVSDRWAVLGQLGELYGQSKVIFNKMTNDFANISLAFVWSIRYVVPGVIRKNFKMLLGFSGTPTRHARETTEGGGVRPHVECHAHPLFEQRFRSAFF